jgi:hypothetical protein
MKGKQQKTRGSLRGTEGRTRNLRVRHRGRAGTLRKIRGSPRGTRGRKQNFLARPQKIDSGRPADSPRSPLNYLPMPGVYLLAVIPYLRLTFTLRALIPALLPAFQGLLLRGAFGHALRRTVCAMGPGQPCESCRLRRACVYTRLFETFIEGPPPPLLRGLPTSPRPYVFEPAFDPAMAATAAGAGMDRECRTRKRAGPLPMCPAAPGSGTPPPGLPRVQGRKTAPWIGRSRLRPADPGLARGEGARRTLVSPWSDRERLPRPGINARATFETRSRLKPAQKSESLLQEPGSPGFSVQA